MDLINLDSGQLFRLQPEYMCSQRDMERLFYFYAAQMFAFIVEIIISALETSTAWKYSKIP